ncbi:MAG: nucleotidyltransferase family protein [Chthoniobacteraceae bacterium]
MSATGQGSIGTVILAAGESQRLGQPKQLLPFRGTTLLRLAAETALAVRCGPVAVVLGAFAESIRPALDGLDVLIVENPGWREGMGTSLRTGLVAILAAAPDLDGVVVMLCDQPLITATSLCLLIESHRANTSAITAAGYSGTLGVPAIFARALFPELLALDGAQGARAVIQRHPGSATGLLMPEAAADVDTAEDFAALKSQRR